MRIIIVDDHPLFRQALRLSVQQQFEQAELMEEASAAGLLARLHADADIDLVLLDLNLPDGHGLDVLMQLRGRYPAVPVMIISAHQEQAVIERAMTYGAMGYIPKSATPAEISSAIDTVLQGELWWPPQLSGTVTLQTAGQQPTTDSRLQSLTPQQHRVLLMLGEGLLNKQIAHELGVSEATIKAHATAIFRKLGVHNRTQAVLAIQNLANDGR